MNASTSGGRVSLDSPTIGVVTPIALICRVACAHARTHADAGGRAGGQSERSQLSAQQLNGKAHALQLAAQSTDVKRGLGFRAHAYGMPHLVAVHDGHLPVGDDEVVGGGGAAIPHAPHRLGAGPRLVQLHAAAGRPQQRPRQNLRQSASTHAGVALHAGPATQLAGGTYI